MTERAVKLREFFLQHDFLPVGSEAYPVFQNYCGDNMLIDLSATLINTWGVALNSVYKNIDGFLSVVWFCDGSPFHEGVPFYFTVLRPAEAGHELKHIVDALYDLSTKAGLKSLAIESIEDRFLDDYKAVSDYDIEISYSDDHSEYIYKANDLLDLSGGANLNKRKRFKKCSKQTDISFLPMTQENVEICLKVQEAWCQEQDCSICKSYAGCEKEALEVLVEVYDDKIYKGIFLCHNNNPIGYTICEKKNDKLAFLSFGKSNIPDFLAYLDYLIVKDHLSSVEYINLGEDMGKEGLRNFKQHLSIHELLKKNCCNFSKRE
jgi:hypothetical protein